jgi:hypothetical protein
MQKTKNKDILKEMVKNIKEKSAVTLHKTMNLLQKVKIINKTLMKSIK